MATFINVRTTEVGQALLAQVHAGSEELTITGIAFGSGAWTDEEYAERNLTALNNEVMRVAPSGGRQSGGAADITCVLTNTALDDGFALTELGVIAEKKDGSEVLYMADCVPPVKSTWISAKDEYRIEIPVTLRIKCSSNSTVEIRVESTVPVTNEDLENHNTAPNAHHDIRELLRTHTHAWSVITGKPSVFPPAGHTHTPNQVGLSNLPNAKSDSVTSTSSNSLATSKAVKIAYDKGKQALDLAGQKAAANHNHNSVYAPKTHNHDSRYYTEEETRALVAGSLLHGECVWFDGAIDSRGYPIDAKTGKADTRFGLCDGRTYRAPDGRKVKTINARDRFIVVAGGKYGKGNTGGAEKVSLSGSTGAIHKHGIMQEHGSPPVGVPLNSPSFFGANHPTVKNTNAMVNSSGGSSHENRPPYVGLFLIKFL